MYLESGIGPHKCPLNYSMCLILIINLKDFLMIQFVLNIYFFSFGVSLRSMIK